MAQDGDPQIAALAQRRLGGKAVTELRGRPLAAQASVAVGPSPPAPISPPSVNPFGSITASSGRAYGVATLAAGVPVYSDRSYRITKVPAQLAGEAFLQTANDDADAQAGVEVGVELKYPSTLFLADDARGERPPAWMRDGWELTDLTIETEDPRKMRVYRREVGAGRVVFGTNRDGVRARKGNYIVVARPKMLAPDGGQATLEGVIAAMPKADAGRGRDLFLSRHGANCAACHRLEGVGNPYAPDLGEIGSRADAGFLIESIIQPSASITEGFAAQLVKTKGGASYAGIILEETGRAVTLAMTGGVTKVVAREEIAERSGLGVSAMPAGFDAMLSAQQVADVATFLLGLKNKQAAGETPDEGKGGGFAFVREGEDRLALKFGDTVIATYVMDDPVLTRRAFVNVKTPSGIPVTREFPAPEAEDHTHMHPGIWLGFGWISGNDYWRLQSKVVFEEFLSEPEAGGDVASFATRNRYLDQSGPGTVCIEEVAYRFSNLASGVRLDIDATYFNDEGEFVFGDQEESGLAFRVAKPLSVQFGNGEIVNDRGGRDGAGTWGKEFSWIDYSGVVDGKRVGILLVPHPENARASWAHSRDYGVLVANPFPKQPRERREPYVKTLVKKGERLRLRYALLIHETVEGEFDPGDAAGRLIGRWER